MESVLPEATHAAKFWQLNYDGTNPHALTDESSAGVRLQRGEVGLSNGSV